MSQPLDPDSVFTLAAQFIVSCPPENPPLPFTAFPGLKVQAQSCFDEATSASSSAGYSASATPSSSDWTPAKPMQARTADQSSVSCAAPSAGAQVYLTPDFSASPNPSDVVLEVFVTFISGLTVVSVEIGLSAAGVGTSIPAGVEGQVYIFITLTDITGGKLSDSEVLFGPAIMEGKSLARSLFPALFPLHPHHEALVQGISERTCSLTTLPNLQSPLLSPH